MDNLVMRKPVKVGHFFRRRYIETKDGLSFEKVADDMNITLTALNSLCLDGTRCCPDMAARLSLYTGASIECWLNMQLLNDLREAAEIKADLLQNR